LRLERDDEALSLFKLGILGILYRIGSVTATDLATREHIRPQSLTRLLAFVEKRGLVSRQSDEADRVEKGTLMQSMGWRNPTHALRKGISE
jgi:DNA-binding MarR family transcriptional regulator